MMDMRPDAFLEPYSDKSGSGMGKGAERHSPLPETPENAPPRSVELEQAVLGACFIRPDLMDSLAELEERDFSEPMHAEMFLAMRSQWQEKRTISAAMMHKFLQTVEQENVGKMHDYMQRLPLAAGSLRLKPYADELRDFANRRTLCALADDLNTHARTYAVTVQDIVGEVVADLDTVLARTRRGIGSRQSVGDVFAALVDRLVSGEDDGSRMTTGLASLDKVTGGWRRKEFAIIAGRPSMGKSAVGMSAMLRTAKSGQGVLYFSMEMSSAAVAARCLSDLSWQHDRRLPYEMAGNGRMDAGAIRAWGEAAAHWGTLPVTIDDQRGLTVAEVSARVRAEAQKLDRTGQRLGLVVVDHLGLIRPSGRYAGNKVNEVGEVSDALATLAKEQDVAVVALHQLNRANEGRDNKRPGLADLRNSGDIEQDADAVLFCYREAYYLERTKFDHGSQQEQQRRVDLEACANSLEILVAKNRHGPTSTVHLYCDMACNVVRDLA